MRLKVKDIQKVRDEILMKQEGKCAICSIQLGGEQKACLDHNHQTGAIRSVLCQNCNGIEGKIYNLCRRGKRERTPFDYLNTILGYWTIHNSEPNKLIHPKHKTTNEKRLARNAKARKKRKIRLE